MNKQLSLSKRLCNSWFKQPKYDSDLFYPLPQIEFLSWKCGNLYLESRDWTIYSSQTSRNCDLCWSATALQYIWYALNQKSQATKTCNKWFVLRSHLRLLVQNLIDNGDIHNNLEFLRPQGPSDQISMFPDIDHFLSLNFKNSRLDSRNNTNCQSMNQQLSLEVQCFNQNSTNTIWCDSDSFWSSRPQIASFLWISSFIPRLQDFVLYNRGYAPTDQITIRISETLKFCRSATDYST